MLKFSEIKNTKWQTTLNSDSVSSGDINMAGRLNWFTMKRLAKIGLTTEVKRVILLLKLKYSKRISAMHLTEAISKKTKEKWSIQCM